MWKMKHKKFSFNIENFLFFENTLDYYYLAYFFQQKPTQLQAWVTLHPPTSKQGVWVGRNRVQSNFKEIIKKVEYWVRNTRSSAKNMEK